MKSVFVAASLCALSTLACQSTGSPTGPGSASVNGDVDGRKVIVRDVIGIVGTRTASGTVTGFAGVLISNTTGACGTAQQSGVTSVREGADVLEIVATNAGAPPTRGTYAVGSTGLAEYFYQMNGSSNAVAGGGTVTFDTVSAFEIAGNFDVNLAGGHHLTGTFSAPVCSGTPTEPWPW